MVRFLDLIAGWGILAVIFFSRKNILVALGGSVILVGLCPLFFCMGAIYRMRREASLLNLLTFLLISLNATNFLLEREVVPPDLAILQYNLIAFLIVFGMAFILGDPLHRLEDIRSRDKIVNLRTNYLWTVGSSSLFSFIYSSLFSLNFMGTYERYPVGRVGLDMVSTCFLAVPVFAAFTLWSIRRWGKHKIDFIVRKDGTAPPDFRIDPKKGFGALLVLILVTGTLLEALTRREFLLWAETLAMMALCVSAVWLIRSRTYGETPSVDPPKEKLWLTPTDVLITVGLHSVILAVLNPVLVDLLARTIKQAGSYR